ncbi:MAG: hypothetical protein HOD90_09940 [Nitrospina sp.]|nr:hypothetical protein [Nitrospina sp.]
MSELWSVFTSLELFALMAYPTSKDSRDKHIANRVAKIKEEWPELNAEQVGDGKRPEGWSIEKWQIFAREYLDQIHSELDIAFSEKGGISSLLCSPNYEKVKTDFDLNCYKGRLAGCVLFWIRRIADSKLASGASINKAVFMTEEVTGKYLLKTIKAKKWPLNQSFIRQDAWLGFKSVSPLWAALECWVHWKKPADYSPFLPNGFIRFISLANNYKEFGVSHFPRAQKIPTLLSEETWPKSEKLMLIDLTLKPSPLSDKELKTLNTYQAPDNYLSSHP